MQELSPPGVAGMGIFFSAVLVFTAGFSSPYWVTFAGLDLRIGLWQYCKESVCQKTWHQDFTVFGEGGLPIWFRGTQVLACIAASALMFGFTARLLYVLGKSRVHSREYLLTAITADMLAACFSFLAAALFGSRKTDLVEGALHWSFGLDILGGILFVGAAVGLLCEYIRH